MEDNNKIIATLGNLFKREGLLPEFEVLSEGACVIEPIGYDNWDGGTDIFGIFCKVPLEIYSKYEYELKSIEESIKTKAEKIFRAFPGCWVGEVVISPELSNEIQGKAYRISNAELLNLLESQKSLMVSVSTGGQQIKSVNDQYLARVHDIDTGLSERGMSNTNSFNDLWAWYGKWSDGTLPKYKDRRLFLSDIFDPLIKAINASKMKSVNPIFEEPTGWERVDRGLGEVKLRLVQASTEEQFQAIGLLCREVLISLAQVVFIDGEHKTLDGVIASKTDAKRMLEAYISHILPGSQNENIRRHARASLSLANDLTHKRTAEFRLSAMCAESTNAVVNIIAIISGRRDPILRAL